MEAGESFKSLVLSHRPSESLRRWLEDLRQECNDRKYLGTDPIGFAHRYENFADQEIVAFISALFAYGNVKAIHQVLEKIFSRLGNRPSERIGNFNARELKKVTSDLYYRFYSAADIALLFECLQKALVAEGSLAALYRKSISSSHRENLQYFQKSLLFGKSLSSSGLRFMFSDPLKGAAKRWHMLLRWLVRKDKIDLGLWTFLSPSDLVLPLDTHLFEISRHLGWCQRRSPNLNAALEITEQLKLICPTDPLRYDFSLCRIGILKLKVELTRCGL